ncbi:hypothetical protein ACP70R_004799 [Stipagrostis hirtigluma subsp. patula]
MAERATMAAPAARPLLRRVLSFREPLLLIPYLLSFLGAAASAFFGSYSSFLQSFARSLVPSPAAAAKWGHASHAAGVDSLAAPCRDAGAVDEDEEDAVLSREEVAAIMATIGVAAGGQSGEGLAARMGRDEVSRLFDAEEPSFDEVRRAFAVFDGNRDGFICAADLQGALARLGLREDAAACRAMIAAANGGADDCRMNLFQFVRFLENGLC